MEWKRQYPEDMGIDDAFEVLALTGGEKFYASAAATAHASLFKRA